MKNNILILALLTFAVSISAQVSSVNYSLKYNAETCLFDCYMNVDKGHSKLLKHRAQFNAQVTILAPAGSVVSVEENYMPLRDNQEYRSSNPASWESTSVINSPATTPNLSYHSFTPFLSPTAFYNDLKEGDDVRLFSVSIEPMVNCASDVRLFENGVDPSSAAEGMQGGDFSNGFTMGGINQLFAGVKEVSLPQGPSIEDFQVTYSKNVNIDFNINDTNLSECQKGLSVEWYGPNGTIAEGTDVPSLTYSQVKSGAYSLKVTDGLGCVTERAITLGNSQASEDKEGLGGQTLLNTKESTSVVSTNVYPNPANQFTNLTINGANGSNVVADVCDVNGKVIMAKVVNTIAINDSDDYKVSLESLTPGMYSIVVYVDGKLSNTHKVLVIE